MVVQARRIGLSDDQLRHDYEPPLTQAELDAAWDYYENNRAEIDQPGLLNARNIGWLPTKAHFPDVKEAARAVRLRKKRSAKTANDGRISETGRKRLTRKFGLVLTMAARLAGAAGTAAGGEAVVIATTFE